MRAVSAASTAASVEAPAGDATPAAGERSRTQRAVSRLRRRERPRHRPGAARAGRLGAPLPAWFPETGRRRSPGRAARPRRPRLGAVAGAPGADADAGVDGRAADHHRRADDHGDRAELDRHRADAGRARPHRLPHAMSAARCSTCCAGSTAGGDRRRALPPREVQPFAAVPRPRRAGGLPGRARAHRRSPKPTCAGRGRSATGRRRRSPSRSRRQLAAGERFVYAYYGGVDKTAHERGFGEFYDAELRAADRLVGDVLDVLPPGAVAAGHRRPRPGRGRRPASSTPAPTLLALVAHAVGRGSLPVVARRPRRGRRAAPRRPPTRYGDVAWVVTREQIARRALVRAERVAPPVAARLGDVALVARAPVSFHDPADAGPFELVCRHGSLTPRRGARAAAGVAAAGEPGLDRRMQRSDHADDR